MSIDDSDHFQNFAKSAEKAIAAYGHVPEEDMTEMQRNQVEELSRLEVAFKKALINDRYGDDAYLYFISYIIDTKKNILVARPFFRERRSKFATHVSKAIRDRNVNALQRHHINYHFINLIMKSFKFGAEVVSAYKKVKAARQELITMNLPLVINRAVIFWRRTPRSHLSFMDLIQYGVEGLIAAVDKYCGEYSKVYRSVIIGRVVGTLIENYSAKMLHFYPADKRKLYRANKFKSKHLNGDYETEDLVDEVSKAVGNETNSEEILGLMAAATIVSADVPMMNDENEVSVSDSISRYAAPEELRPDLLFENVEAQVMMQRAIAKLNLFDKKLLRLKGVEVSLT